MADKNKGNTTEPPLQPESLVISADAHEFKSPFNLSPPGNSSKATATNDNNAVSSDGGSGVATAENNNPSTLPSSTPLRPEFSASPSFKIPRSISRADSRLTAPLELALNELERPDGARETRILLPGVDLRQEFGYENAAGEASDDENDGGDDCEGLTVLQTPKGVSLREALWGAAAIQERQASISRPSSRPSSSAAGIAAAAWAAGSNTALNEQSTEPSTWGALVSNLAEGGTTAGTPARTGAPSIFHREEDTHADSSGKKDGNTTNRPDSQSYITPPTISSLPAAASGATATTAAMKTTPAGLSAATGRLTPGNSFVKNLRIDVSYTPSMHPLSSPSDVPLSPAPMVTPGAPLSVPVELRAAAAEHLWPLLAPFAPHMLRDDILTPPDQRRFVRAVTHSAGSPSKSNLTTTTAAAASTALSSLPSPTTSAHHQQRLSFDYDRNQDTSALPLHPNYSSPWHLDTEMKAESQAFQAAIAIADISGFTALTEVLTKTGSGGVELLTRCMNSYFAQVIDLVTLHGGDVSKFAGDAMLIVFAPTKDEIAATAQGDLNDGGLGAATRRAAVAAKELVDKFGVMSMMSTGEAIAVPRSQVMRQGSKFVRRESVADADAIGRVNSEGGGLIRRGTSAGIQTAASLTHGAAKTGQKFTRKAAFASTAGSKALAAPFKMMHSRLNYLDLSRTTDTPGPGSGRRQGKYSKSRRYPLEGEDLWMDWLQEKEKDDGRSGASGSVAGGLTKTQSASDVANLSIDNNLKQQHPPPPPGGVKEEEGDEEQRRPNEEQQAEKIRTIHQQTLMGLAKTFQGGHLMRIRPPELPDRPPGEEEEEEEETTAYEANSLAGIAAAAAFSAENNKLGYQPPRPKSAPGAVYSSITTHDSFIDRHGFVDNSRDRFNLRSMPSDASAVTATTTASMTSNRNNSFGSFTSTGGGDGGGIHAGIVGRGAVAPRLPSVSEKEGSGGGGDGTPWPSTVRKLVSRAFRFGNPNESNQHQQGTNSVFSDTSTLSNTSATSGYPFSASMHSATSQETAVGLSSSSLSRRNLRLRLLHPTASWSAPASPQNSPPESPREHHQEGPTPQQPSFSFQGGGSLAGRGRAPGEYLAREYSAMTSAAPDGILPPLTGQDSAPINAVADGLPDDLLYLKVILATGTLCAYRVGGVMEPTAEGCPEAARWEFFVGDSESDDNGKEEECDGEKEKSSGGGRGGAGGNDEKIESFRGPIKQLKETECHASSGNVVISKEVVQILAHDAELMKFADGAAELIGVSVDAVGGDQMRSRPGLNSQIMNECIRLSTMSPQERVDAYQILRSHVPFNVRSRVESGHIDSVNEVRVCTVVFLGFPSLGTHKSAGAEESLLSAVQSVVQAAQCRMHQDGGFFLQMRCDEKGYLALCAFGLPGRAHEDSPSRGVHAALAVISHLQRQGYAAVAGVTTGNLFCGVVGSSRRAEYTVFGDAINFAARLMVRASQNAELGSILCDETTRWMAAPVADYTALDPVPVKGRAQPLRAFKVLERNQWTVTGMADILFDASPVLPRFLNAAQKERQRQEYQKQQHEMRNSIEVPVETRLQPPVSAASAAPPAPAGLQKTEEAFINLGLLQKAKAKSTFDPRKDSNTSSNAAIAMFGPSVKEHPLQIMSNSFAALVGREKELATAGARLADLVDGRGGGALFIEGVNGLGKSRIIEELAWGEGLASLREGCIVIASAGRVVRQSEPLNPWRRVFKMIFNADLERSAKKRALAGKQGEDSSQLGNSALNASSSSSLLEKEGGVVPSDLAIRLAQHVPDYAVWRPVVASALGLRVEELPIALGSATQRSAAARQGGRVAVDDVSLLLKARAHTFNHASEFVSGDLDEIINSEGAGDAGNTSTAITTTTTSASASAVPTAVDGGDGRVAAAAATERAVQYSGRSISSRNLDPGRPNSSASHHSEASLDQGGRASSASNANSGGGGGGGCGPTTTRIGLPPVEMSPQLRALKLRGLLVAIIREFVAAHAPLFILFDDVHLFDGPSWRLLLAMLASCRKEVLFVCTLRPVLLLPSIEEPPSLPLGLDAPRHSSKSHHLPLTTPPGESPTTPIGPSGLPSTAAPGGLSPDEVFSRKLGEYYQKALWKDGTERIALKNFSLGETGQFLSESLVDGDDIPWPAIELLHEKSAGMPSYLHQMCLFFKIRAQELAKSDPFAEGTSAGRTISTAAVAASADFPSSVLSEGASMVEVARVGMDFVRATINVYSIVPARVDRLRPDEQLTLKVASAMGATVYTELLQASHPKNPSMRRLQANLQALAAAGFLTRQSDIDNAASGGGGGLSRHNSKHGNMSSNYTWQFTDLLARDAIWDMIPLTQRREWQARLATAMASFGTNTHSGGGNSSGNLSTNPYSNRKPIPPAIIAYHWSKAALGVETTEWQSSLQAIYWWERAASEASLTGDYDEEIALLHNATIITNALVLPRSTGSFHARPDLVPEWRRARWERCAAAALLMASAETAEDATQSRISSPSSPVASVPASPRMNRPGEDPNSTYQHYEKESLVHCLRALNLLHVPMPWSIEYRKEHEKAVKLKKASKIGRLVKIMTRKVKQIAITSAGKIVKTNKRGISSLGTLPDSTGLVRATLAGDFSILSRLEPEKDDGYPTEQAEPLIAVALLAAVVTSAPNWQHKIANYRYILWACEHLAGGPRRIMHGSALSMVVQHARTGLRRAKGCGGASGLSRQDGEEEGCGDDVGGDNDNDGEVQFLQSLKEAFNLQRTQRRPMKRIAYYNAMINTNA